MFPGSAVLNPWLLGGVGAVFLALGSAAWMYRAKAANLETRLDEAHQLVGKREAEARANQAGLEHCLIVNEANRWEAQIQAARARDAELRLAEAGAQADNRIEDFTDEATAFRDRPLDCPALDADFRRWVRE